MRTAGLGLWGCGAAGLFAIVAGFQQVGCFPIDYENCTGCTGGGGQGAGGSTSTTTTTTTPTSSSNSGGGSGTGGAGGQGGTVGEGGSGGGGVTCPRMLDDTDLVAQYFINNADGTNGQAPSMLMDAAAGPLPLTVNNATNMGDKDPTLQQSPAHGGLEWSLDPDTLADAKAYKSIQGTKIFSQLNNHKAATLELVLRLTDVYSAGSSMLLSIGSSTQNGDGTFDERLSLAAYSTTGVQLLWDASGAGGVNPSTVAGAWTVDLATRRVLHLVLDTTQGSERVRLYQDGMPANTDPSITTIAPAPDQQLEMFDEADEFLTLGGRAGSSRPFQGVLYYAALYNAAFSGSRAMEHACKLLASDDAP